MEITKQKQLVKLFLTTFQISACTIGGGYVIVPLMRKKFVEELGWIDEEEMLDLTAIAQSCPGAMAVNCSILVGYRTAGVGGALLTMLGTILPPLLIISVVSLFYQAFRDNLWVSRAMTGMLCGVAAVILNVVVKMAGDVAKKKDILHILLMVGTFLAVRLLNINIVLVLLACGAAGGIRTWLMLRRKGGQGT